MLPHRLSLILPWLALPVLIGCSAASGDSAPPPLDQQALAAVVKQPGAPREALARAVDRLFTAEEMAETRAVLVLKDGRVVAERYAPGYHENTRFISWSMAKTITAVMIGQLVADGRLRLDESVPIPAWQRAGDPRGEITLRQLLQMRSGLKHTEAGQPVYESDEVRMLFLDGRDNMAKWAEEQPLEAEPGKKFEYSSNTSVILADIAARALTSSTRPEVRRKAVADYLHQRLFGPLGMTSMVPEFDASGTLIGGSLMHATARDWAKFGEFLRLKGRTPGGEQLVPQRWVEAMVTPSPTRANYGFQIWLNRNLPKGEDQALFPDRAPASLFSLIGHMGQYVLVSPSQRVVLVRLGHSDAKQRPPMLQEAADVLELYPAS